MRGGGEAGITEQWKQVALTEPDSRRRDAYAALALVFADLAKVRLSWKQALEGWNVTRSEQVMEWQTEARRADLLRLLNRRFPPQVPPDLAAAIQKITDGDELTRWFDALLDSSTLQAFRAAVGR